MAPGTGGGSQNSLSSRGWRKTAEAPPERNRARKSRSSSRRRRIREELQAKAGHSHDAWQLQQQLLIPGASEDLMAAARQLLPDEEYAAVVEERALEGVCGYPPCTRPAAGTSRETRGKRWAIDSHSREVHDQQDIGRFCSRECMRLSKGFDLRLDPDPAYCRPASAVAASRSAVATATEAAEAAGTVTEAAPQTTEPNQVPPGDVAPQQQQPQQPQQQQQQQQQNVPKVRPRAVVRFSRTNQTYTVQYADYDGGGGLPDVLVGTETTKEEPIQTVRPAGEPIQTVRPAGEKKVESVREILNAPVLERGHLEPASSAAADDRSSDLTAGKTEAVVPDSDNRTLDPGTAEGDDDQDSDAGDDASSGEDFYEAGGSYPMGWSGSPFVRVWGVLTSWISDFALEVLRGARVEQSEEGRPAHKGRRDLLGELLSSRLPGDLTFLAPRFHDVISALSVHQTLPSVTEGGLYDLVAALVLRAIYRIDVRRGQFTESVSSAAIIDRHVELAARHMSIAESELEVLDAMLA